MDDEKNSGFVLGIFFVLALEITVRLNSKCSGVKTWYQKEILLPFTVQRPKTLKVYEPRYF